VKRLSDILPRLKLSNVQNPNPPTLNHQNITLINPRKSNQSPKKSHNPAKTATFPKQKKHSKTVINYKKKSFNLETQKFFITLPLKIIICYSINPFCHSQLPNSSNKIGKNIIFHSNKAAPINTSILRPLSKSIQDC
jgi:hypothetical protein